MRERCCLKILSASRTLADFPCIGRAVPDLGDENIWERFVYYYRLVYRVVQKNHEILKISVVRRDL